MLAGVQGSKVGGRDQGSGIMERKRKKGRIRHKYGGQAGETEKRGQEKGKQEERRDRAKR
jgi:hypothetical protein